MAARPAPAAAAAPAPAAAAGTAPAGVGNGPLRAATARSFVELIYQGPTALTAIGPVTQTRYRFAGPGARLRVDARDAPALGAITTLRRI
jgi:hypothetical protein